MKREKLKNRVFKIIESPDNNNIANKVFEIIIVSLIVVSMVLIIADTFQISDGLREIFHIIEIFTLIVFTLEYIVRLWTADLIFPEKKPSMSRLKYAVSFMALVDLFSIFPFYIPFIIPLDLRVLRTLRIVRLLRLFKVNRYTSTFTTIGNVFKKKFTQLLSAVFIIFLLMIITSVLMHNVEHEAQPEIFTNAFSSFWWAISTLTTIGYGDIVPLTVEGQVLTGIFAFLGIGLVAIPTAIISAGFVEQSKIEKEEEEAEQNEKCFCPYCGKNLDD